MPIPSKTQVARWRVLRRTRTDLLEHLCESRGLDVSALEPDFSTQLHDPSLLPDIGKAVDLIKAAQKNNWPVVIFGDYDADGTPAAALLALVLERLDIDCQVILPTRSEGYGLQPAVIERLPVPTKLLITVDTGVTAVAEIALAQKRGIKVMVIDHHLPKAELPAADAIIDPFLPGSRYPFPHLCGCALAYKFTQALAEVWPDQLNEAFRKWLLDLVAISTVADMMPLVGENRVLVHYGLQVLRKTRRPGLQALLAAAGLSADKITAGSLGFTIGPRLNASGRLDDNRPALDLLLAREPNIAAQLAEIIEKNNRQRQAIVEEVMVKAEHELFKQNSPTDRCFVLVGDDWPAGVLGLVAGKLTGSYLRPSIVLSENDGLLSGSARSINEYSMIDGLSSQANWLTRYGGHQQAAGLSLPKQDLKRFVDGIKTHAAERIKESDLVPSYLADSHLEANDLTLELAEKIGQLGPFGFQNTTPLFVIHSVELGSPRLLGASGDHSKWQARIGQTTIDAIGFGMGKRPPVNGPTDLLAHLEVNRWRDRVVPQLRLVDFRPSGSEIEVIDAKS